jgi:hypothetical protein
MKREIQYVVKHFLEMQEHLNELSESDEDSNLRYSEKKLTIPNLNGQNLLWRTKEVFWVSAYERVESYEGSAIQIGISQDGKLVWEAQGHCSCYGWHNSERKEVKEFADFKELLNAIEPQYEHDAITDGNTPTHLTDVESKFWETLKGLIVIAKLKYPVLENTSHEAEAKQQ